MTVYFMHKEHLQILNSRGASTDPSRIPDLISLLNEQLVFVLCCLFTRWSWIRFDASIKCLKQAFRRKACDRTRTPWHTPTTSEVCIISHVVIPFKRVDVVASSVGFYDEFNVHCLLFLPIFNTQCLQK